MHTSNIYAKCNICVSSKCASVAAAVAAAVSVDHSVGPGAMSDWSEVDLGRLVLPECSGIYVDSWWGQLLVAIDLFPLTMTLVIFGASVRRSEFIMFYGGLTLSVNLWLNYGLRRAFQQPGPAPPCGGNFQMPALATQHSVCIALFVLLVVAAWSLRVSMRNMSVLMAFVGTVTYARIYIGKNSAQQLMAGVGFGTLMALASFFLYRWLIHPYVEHIIRWPIVRWFGFANTLGPNDGNDVVFPRL